MSPSTLREQPPKSERTERAPAGTPALEKRDPPAGKLDARRRIELLLDPGSFAEIDALVTHRCRDFGMADRKVPGDGIITGRGTVDGRQVFVSAHDFKVFGGSVSETGGRKICKIQDLAVEAGAPIISLAEGGGARIQEGVVSLSGYGEICWRTARASGVVPQITAIMGPCAGGSSYVGALMDFVFMVDHTSYMFVTGPEVIRQVCGQETTKEELGGSRTHATETGSVHFRRPNDAACLSAIRELLSYLPSNNLGDPPAGRADDPPGREEPALDALVPEDPNTPFDVKELITPVVDGGRFLEVQPEYGPNLVVGFARLAGRSVGIVANQPRFLAGALDVKASIKGARFVRFCDAFNLPVVTFVDVPGYMPGIQEELGGIIRNGAKFLYAYSEATVPLVTVIVRKAYGGAYGVMGSKHLHTDVSFAYPTAEIAVMGAESAVRILHRRELAAAGEERPELLERKVGEYRERFANPYYAAGHGFVDAVIEPRRTRFELCRALRSLAGKRSANLPRKHGNMPL
jgi:propionyl-CoA carboxylase beta chain